MEEKRKKNLNQSPIALINKIAFDKMEWKQEDWWNYRTLEQENRSIHPRHTRSNLKEKEKERDELVSSRTSDKSAIRRYGSPMDRNLRWTIVVKQNHKRASGSLPYQKNPFVAPRCALIFT